MFAIFLITVLDTINNHSLKSGHCFLLQLQQRNERGTNSSFLGVLADLEGEHEHALDDALEQLGAPDGVAACNNPLLAAEDLLGHHAPQVLHDAPRKRRGKLPQPHVARSDPRDLAAQPRRVPLPGERGAHAQH